MRRRPSPLETRAAAAQATLDHFRDRPFALGSVDCAKMVTFHCRRMGLRIRTAKAGSYSTPVAARAALKRCGFGTLAEMADAYFPRIPPAAAVVGDIVEVPGNGPLGTLAIALGNGRVLCFHEDVDGAIVGEAKLITAAWRTL